MSDKVFAGNQPLFDKEAFKRGKPALVVVPSRVIKPMRIFPFATDDGDREGTCQDWETDATFYKLGRCYGEQKALDYMQRTFGEEYPKKGMALAMGTHSLYPDVWLINGVIRLDGIKQMSLGL